MTPDALQVFRGDTTLTLPTTVAALLRNPVVAALQRTLTEMLLYQGARLTGADAESPEVVRLWDALQRTPLMGALRMLAQGYLTGFALVEVVYENALPIEFRAAPLTQSVLLADARGRVVGFEVYTNAGKQTLPLERALYFLPYQRIDTPFGDAPLMHAKDAIERFDEVNKYLAQYLKRHAVPTLIGKFAPSLTESERKELAQKIKELQNASYGLVPEGNHIEVLEPRGGSVEFALEYLRYLERLIARVILGPILAVYEAEFGTRAQAQTHHDVLKSIVAGLQAPLEQAVDAQLWQPLMRMHLGRVYDARFELREPEVLSEPAMRLLGEYVMAGLLPAEQAQELLRRYYDV